MKKKKKKIQRSSPDRAPAPRNGITNLIFDGQYPSVLGVETLLLDSKSKTVSTVRFPT